MRYTRPYIRARLLFHRKFVFPDGAIVEMKAWAVLPSSRTPDGCKYSLVYIDADGRRVLGFDNAEGKGHHRHDGARESPFEFTTIEALIATFMAEFRRLRGSIS